MAEQTFARPGYTPPALDPAVRQQVLDQALAEKLGRSHCLFSTITPEGYPRLIGMGYLNDGWRSYLSTIKGIRKVLDIEANPRVTILLTDTNVRRDHFIQIDGIAIEQTGEDQAEWQRRRFIQWPHEIEMYDARNQQWTGWIVEPLRVRVLGLLPRGTGYWSEAPVLFKRHELGLPPLEPPFRPAKRGPLDLSEVSYRVLDLEREAAFWEEAIGLERIVPAPGASLDRWVCYDVGGPRFQIARAERRFERAETKADFPGEPTFLVSDIEAMIDRALAAGATKATDLRSLGGDGREPLHQFVFLVSPGGIPFGLVEGGDPAYRKFLRMRPRLRYW
jgi:general stress protein 26